MAERLVAFFPDPIPEEDRRLDAKHRLADAVRQLGDDVVLADSVSGAEALDRVTAIVERARAELASMPRLPSTGPMVEVRENLQSERSLSAGRSNPAAAPVHLESSHGDVVGWAVYGAMYDGSYGFVHGGGLMVALLDVIAAGLELRPDVQPGHVGSLTVRFHAPLPVGQRVEFEGRFDRAEGRKTFFTSVARTGDTLIASAEAVCIAPRTELTV